MHSHLIPLQITESQAAMEILKVKGEKEVGDISTFLIHTSARRGGGCDKPLEIQVLSSPLIAKCIHRLLGNEH